ncbi:hypothetical protein AAG906_023576 [Vitis piasezkii]
MASSSSSFHYDVFLSFRDDEKLKGGQAITPALVTAVENSTASVVLLSENYASSSCCLEELRVLPIFYKIDPSDVGNQRGKFGEALAKHEKNLENRELMVRIWRDALTKHFGKGMDEPLRKSIDDASPNDIMRDLIKLTAEIRALIELIGPDDDAIVRDLTQLASEISALMKLIGPLDDAAVRDLIRLASEVEARILSIIPNDKENSSGCNSSGIMRRFVGETHQVPSRTDKRLQRRMEEVRSISSDHVAEDLKRQGKPLSKVSGCKNLVVSNYANASILILVLDSWNLLYVLFWQSCEDVFHGSPVTIFCELKLSDLRSCEVGCFGNPLNWGDGVVREVVLAEVVGERSGKGENPKNGRF